MRRRSAFLRLTAGLGIAFFAATSAVLAIVYFLVASHLDERMRVLVASDLTGLTDLYAQRRLPALRQAIAARLERGEAEDAVYALLNKDGSVLAGNLSVWPDGLPADGTVTRFSATPIDGVLMELVGSGSTFAGGFRLAVGHSVAENRQVLDRLLAILLATGLVMLIIGVAGAALLSRWLVSRIVTVNRVAGLVRDGNLAARVPSAEERDEFGELAANFNAMLDRIQRLVTGIREVSDRIAHELRTPLTRLSGQVAKLGKSGGDSEEALAAVDAEITTTVGMFDALLDIAATEAEAGDNSRLKTVDLTEVVTTVVDLYDAVAEERGIKLAVRAHGPAEMLGDRDLLVRMLANVVDNAIKFSPDGGAVSIALERRSANHVLSVADTGPGLSDDIRGRAFDRFARGTATAAVPGHGLGLALVKAIAVRHGIRVTLENTEQGLKVVFVCPALTG